MQTSIPPVESPRRSHRAAFPAVLSETAPTIPCRGPQECAHVTIRVASPAHIVWLGTRGFISGRPRKNCGAIDTGLVPTGTIHTCIGFDSYARRLQAVRPTYSQMATPEPMTFIYDDGPSSCPPRPHSRSSATVSNRCLLCAYPGREMD